MKKLFCLIFSLLIATPVFAGMTVASGTHVDSAKLESLLQYPGLTFYKDFTNGTVDAEFSAGSKTGTYTRTGGVSAPTTYMDGSGLTNLVTTSDVPLFDLSYADTLGVHVSNLGYHSYRSSTNYLLDSNFGRDISTDNWVSTYGTLTDSASQLFNIAGAKRRRIDYTYTGGETDYSNTMYQLTANDTFDASGGNVYVSVSFWARGNVSGITTARTSNKWFILDVDDNAGSFVVNALYRSVTQGLTDLSPTQWNKFSFSYLITNTSARKVRASFMQIDAGANKPAAGENFWLEIEGVQIEKLPYSTPHIPTTTASLTRNGDSLTYATLGNRSADEETIFIKFTPGSTFANDGTTRYLLSVYSSDRRLQKYSSIDKLQLQANSIDSNSNSTISLTTPTINTSYVVAGVVKHSSPYSKIYFNGSSDGTPDTTHNFVNNLFGTTFNIGRDTAATGQLDGNIASVTIFKRAMSDAGVAAVSTILQ